ncbi:Cell division protein FtsQ [Corynebacterium capitovis DSM 44611]|uniref:cell division protein FtsQ/DivIB n=1 Tax=Corynebacterium capitovis TaxID=131081 RepID=UPI000376595A|nr:FtsQ-type POTRA domain-containing protein [Corynebacterium capitovis]WKD57368.1 Cell division protein FtsQ [Corynebacterium capitovis DSM 44611]
MSTVYVPSGAHEPAQDADGQLPADTGGNRTRARRRTTRVAVVALVLVVLCGVVAAVVPFTPLLPVHNITVEGESHVSASEVTDAAGVVEGTPIGRVDLHGAATGVAGLPWVRSATATRHWPSSINIVVVENEAVAYIGSAGDAGANLLDAEGVAFATDTPPPGAVELKGSAVDDEAARAAGVSIVASISEASREAIAAVEATGPHNFVLKLRDNRTVIWGAAEDNANKAVALETVLRRKGQVFNISNPELVTVK